MTRPLRIVSRTALGFSLLLCIAIAVLWVRSYFIGEWIILHQRFEETGDGVLWTHYLLRTGNGGIGFGRYARNIGPDSSSSLHRLQKTPLRRTAVPAAPDNNLTRFQTATIGQVARDRLVLRAPRISEVHGQGPHVGADGKVSINLIGNVDVAGLTAEEVAARMKSLLSKYYDAKDANITVALIAERRIFLGPRPIQYSFLGFNFDRTGVGWPATLPQGKGFGIVIPFWAAFLLFVLPTLHWIFKRFRARRRGRRALCPTCGYDMRATPDRCPECGTTAPCLLRRVGLVPPPPVAP